MVEQKTQAQEKGVVGAVAQPPAPRQFGKDRLAEPEPIRQMKKIVVMRHGHCNEHDQISDYGKQQVEHAAEMLRELVAGKNVLILTSPTCWVPPTAKLLGEKLGIAEPKEDERLGMGSRDLGRLADELPKMDADVVILVTHQPEACALSSWLHQGSRNLKNGEFVMADL
jgi:phosphohistidine phosphatase SixA